MEDPWFAIYCVQNIKIVWNNDLRQDPFVDHKQDTLAMYKPLYYKMCRSKNHWNITCSEIASVKDNVANYWPWWQLVSSVAIGIYSSLSCNYFRKYVK